MKKVILLICGTLIWFSILKAQTKVASWLIDFGPVGNTQNCKPTASPDKNGLFWNNFTGSNGGASLPLLDSKGGQSSLTATTVQGFVVNAGDLMGPTADNDHLGELGIGTASMDFFFAQNSKPSLKITGLDPNLGYVFYLYGSRLTDETRITTYTLTGGNTCTGDLQTSGKDMEGIGKNGNLNKVFKTPMLFADRNGTILLEMQNKVSAFGYLNALKLEAYEGAKVKISSISLEDGSITSLGGTLQMQANIAPADASITALIWSVDDASIAAIDQNGLLKAKADGTVIVTVTSLDDPAIKSSCRVQISGQAKPSNILLVDFGPAGNTDNCKPTASPDGAGNYWTNLTDNLSGASIALTDVKGNATAIRFTNLGEFGANPSQLMGPLSVSDGLAELSTGTATMDFFYVENKTTSFEISGLDPEKGYRFTLFGSRITTETRITGYTFHGISTVSGSLQTSGSDLGGPGNHTNISSTYISPIMYPDPSGQIQLDVKNNSSAYGYLNDLKLEVFENIKVPVEHITVTGQGISTPGGTAQMEATIDPVGATVKAISWSVDNSTLATIDSTGLIKALGNGTVQVKATSKDNPDISGTLSIQITGQLTVKQTVLIDLGPLGNSDNCKPTESPDNMGHYWNNFTGNNEGDKLDVIDRDNNSTGWSIQTTKIFSINPGSLMGPTTTSPLLGDLNIGTATMDFFFVENNTGTLEFDGLNPLTAYRLNLYGSRLQDEVRKTEFTIKGISTYIDTLQTSGKDLEGAGINTNISQLITTPILFADSTGKLTVTLRNVASAYGYLNALSLESLDMEIIAPTKISIEGNDIDKPGGGEQLKAVIIPENATVQDVYWSVDNPAIARIDENGYLQAISNGEVTVTAKSRYYGSTTVVRKTFQVTNQYQQMYISGSALSDSQDESDYLAMHLLKTSDGNSSGVFEIYTRLKNTGNFHFSPENKESSPQYGMGVNESSIMRDGPAFSATGDSTVRIRVNMAAGTISVLPIEQITVKGATGEVKLNYSSLGIWSGQVSMDKVINDGNKNFFFQLNQGDDFRIYHITGTEDKVMVYEDAQQLGYDLDNIQADYNTYNLTLDLNRQTYSIACASLDSKKITIMGSSVAFGFGAADNHGYNYLYGQLLAKRFDQSRGKNWNLVNKAISGNNTINVLDRWNRDLAMGCGKYVIIGLSLGNEGIHESQDKEATFNQFKENLLKMMALARADNMIPVINNNYTRSDYTSDDYSYIKKMDLFIHQLDAPSMNLLGAIDDGNGHWAADYRYDDLHPNDAGHEEMLYTIVPSLFDALDNGKPLPRRQSSSATQLSNTVTLQQYYFLPEDIVHSFTFSLGVKTKGTGTLAYFTELNQKGVISLDASNGTLIYTSPKGSGIKTSTILNDDKWHTITLTHFYARGATILYVDGVKTGEIDEKLVPSYFYINDLQAPETLSIKDLFFYRAGMSPEAITALQEGKMLKSSLEFYAPLSQGDMSNLAQSTNTLLSKKTPIDKSDKPTLPTPGEEPSDRGVVLYPNPVRTLLQFVGLTSGKSYQLNIYNSEGKQVLHTIIQQGDQLGVGKLSAGKYFVLLIDSESGKKQKFSIIKL